MGVVKALSLVIFLAFGSHTFADRKPETSETLSDNNQFTDGPEPPLAYNVYTSLLDTTHDGSNVNYVGDGVWKWKRNSRGKEVVKNELLGVDDSFSMSFNFKTTSRGRQTVLQILYVKNSTLSKFVTLTINGKKSYGEVTVADNNETVSSTRIQFSTSIYKTWTNFHLSFTRNELRIQISCDDVERVTLSQNIASIFNSETMFVVGDTKIGHHASYQGFMSNILIHKPAPYEYPWTCADGNKVYTKRGASLRTNDDSVDRLNRIVRDLQRSMVALERRVAVRETCECISEEGGADDAVCFDNDGNVHQNGETWDVNACLRCSCIDRIINCANHSTSCYHLSPCQSQPCQNNGYCEDDAELREGFKCRCQYGYFGDLCEDVNPCSLSEVCHNGGICTFIRSNEYHCACKEGFTGKQCTSPLACTTNPCENGGTCEDQAEGEYICECAPGFTGITCSDEEINPCEPNPCMHDGMCYEMGDSDYRCRCRGIYRGINCEVEDWCYSEPCQNGGQCSNNDNGFTCDCPPGFTGLVCENSDVCEPSPCQNGGECREYRGSYKCECPPGYIGNDCEDMDECASEPCLNGGRCVPLEDTEGYSCVCPPSHVGENCEHINECSGNPCLNGGACDTLPNGEARCRCRLTHYGDRCENMDYCRGNPCKNDAICRNNPGNVAKPFNCDCKDTFIGDLCEFKDLCRESPCFNGGRCEMLGPVRRCICPPLYYGRDCEAMDYCRDRPCRNGGKCINEERGYLCVCQKDYTGSRCENRHPCRPNPCRNNGVCTIVDELQIRCECPPSHYGRFCTQEDRCRNNPCLNGGVCVNTADDFECKCVTGFRGKTCALTELCKTNPCRNGGTCVEDNDTFRCICPESHQGTYCEFNCNVCMSLPEEGSCVFGSGVQSSVRWYYNKNDQSCEQFQYSGCGGNGNNFITRQDCRRRCIVGSCCSVDITTSQTSCRFTSINQCKKTNQRSSNIQVLSFEPGKRCNRHSCKEDKTCKVGLDEYRENERTNVGCGKACTCSHGALLCTCREKSTRREIQRLTTEERNAFIKAVRTLKFSEEYNGRNSWDALRDEYIQHAAIAQEADYFLLWNRAFLWKMEFLLKKIDCSVTLPFYDFTLDAGSFENAVIWQPNFFGGNGGSDGCVKYHMFKEFDEKQAEWKPCISRSFNLSVGIPNMIDISKAMNSRSYKELSTQLQQIASNLHAFIGGDMFLTSRAYDPLFYVIHAYIDHVFMMWQELNPDNEDLQHIPGYDVIQFGTSPHEVWRGACVEYLPYTYPLPCNRSVPTPELFGSEGYNLQGYNRQGFNREGFDKDGFDVMGHDVHGQPDTRNLYDENGYNSQGYNRSGYDENGYDRYGFDVNGVNREGYNTLGFNNQGHNRYGLDQQGFDKRGYNIYGMGRDYKPDLSSFYDEETGFNDCCFGRDGLTSLGQDRFGYSIEGFDEDNCNYFFSGPHTLYYQQKLWPMLHVQMVPFLSTIPRNCRPVTQLSDRYYTLNWIQDLPDMSYSIYSPMKQGDSNEAFTQRLCFDVNLLLTWCPCLEENYPAVCTSNPCENAQCPLHQNARCTINMCGETCKAEFVQDGRIVNCDNPCSMNPCQNGGTCLPSRFSSDAESYRCECPAEYTGTLCEQPVADMCMLDKATGNCGGRFRRWFYNRMTMECEEFVFTGCDGNPNNFASKKACDLSCSTGACCYRFPINQTFEIGFDRDGYDKYGFNKKGFNRLGQQRSEYDSMPTGNRINPPKGFGPDGFDIYGYDEKGIDRQGYDRSGYHDDTGYNRTGYNPDGEFDALRGFDREGFDANGFDRSGFSCSGIDREGFNQLGLYYDFSYTCQTLYLHECEALRDPSQLGVPFEVISFSPGKNCGEVECGESCGCDYKGKKYHFGETFHSGCNKCACSLGGVVNCQCLRIGKRMEIRDMSQDDFHKYVKAVQQLHMSKKWEGYAQLHAEHMPQANGADISLPWHRYFLRMIEDDIRDIAGCSISIPYFDWTIDTGDLENSQIWQANYFGSDGCVKYQPFASEDTWHPCIRRMFNTSINLPDAVTMQFIIREPAYERFRLQLETVSGLFHLWVGGHMASPFSPYDPIYLSHWAFMDMIWSEWQKRNPDGISRFPPASRYIKMKPFDVTPDDLFSTEQQICVVYTPPTLGTSCNKTSTLPLTRTDDGFDRHGFDAEGYDMDGYNARGYNRRGRPDRRQLFDEEGYNKFGYDRGGFDRFGWDIFGFNRQNYNRDGIDIEGFDKSGFNRYGFDQSGKTPFGMYKNGRFAPGVDRGYAASLFDKFGYNRLGFDKFGLDHQGFDVFGFDKGGFDQDDCNYFNNGPHYMTKFYITVTQLNQLHPESLKLIARICEPITALPEYWLSQTWLAKLPVIREIEESWKVDHKYDASWRPRTSSLTEDKLWNPISPEAQFCFKLEDFGDCPIGIPLVECPENLCDITQCASQPSAQCRMKNCGSCYPEFYNGNTGEIYECYGCIDSSRNVHTEGSMWEEDCQSCLCQAGMISCHPKMCPKVMCSHPAKSSGTCCEACEDCDFEDHVYRDGQTFRPDRCKTCTCRKGNVLCENTVTNCPAVSCENPLTIPGECCPSCPADCMGHRENDVWDMGSCETCVCRNGRVKCTAKPCPVVQCSHPIRMAGECCEECTGCVFESRKYVHGQNFMQNECTQCTCSFGNVQCVTQNCPRLTCENQETPKGSCCPRCRTGCKYQGTFYDEGTTFQPSGTCLSCSCQDEEVRCSRATCPAVSCASPTVRPGRCCPECVECHVGRLIYSSGQRWSSDDGCESCSCEQGTADCRPIANCPDTCNDGVPSQTNRCCKDCSLCLYNGRRYQNGAIFAGDRCETCSCQSGNVRCTRQICDEIECTGTEPTSDGCCRQCRSCSYKNRKYEHGASWRFKDGTSCGDCTCMEGRVSCIPESCPPAQCTNPTYSRNGCCKTCDGCRYQGREYSDGDRLPTRDRCSNCHCERGNINCQPLPCPDVSCETPVTPAGECCPRCVSCSYDGEEFDDGESFVAPLNPCLQCSCSGGEATCNRLDLNCPHPRCSNPGRQRDVCCPTCNICEYQRRMYDDGEVFRPSGASNCLTCTCNNGNVKCDTKECPPVTCHNPITLPGECCPKCEECVDNGRTYENGASWRREACEVCMCVDGVSDCNRPECPRLPCSHPAQVAGECCPTCNFCLYQGTVYSDRARFKSSEDNCVDCVCNRGTVTCDSVRCERLTCRRTQISDGDCCATCITQCTIGELTLVNGDRIDHPSRRCTTCVCADGELECDAVRCPLTVGCRNPTMGECCRDRCDNCEFYGATMQNGDRIPHPRDSCRLCTCTNGDVSCIAKVCPAIDCDDAVQSKEDPCCMECPFNEDLTCNYNGREIKNEQRFRDSCQICECLAGLINCEDVPCPQVSCQYPTQSGCCKVCTGCSISGELFDDNQAVASPSGNQCELCRCTKGEVTCSLKRCPRVSCAHPTRDECCEVCDGCTYQGHAYSNEETFPSPDDRCDVCTCSMGEVTCSRRSCRAVTCSHPTKAQGDCCPSCDNGCMFEGSVIPEDRGLFTSSEDVNGCEVCACQHGSVICKQKICSKVNCRNPIMDTCNCPVCTDCKYNGATIPNKRKFPNPEDAKCSECSCMNGNVVCGRQRCPSPACTHPVSDECGCPSCEMCFYFNKQYRNGESFPDQQDKCNRCQCRDGNAICKSKPCIETSCKNPAEDDCGCDLCVGCSYLGADYDNGEEFVDVRNKCNTCTCEESEVTCKPIACPPTFCASPQTTPGECCPVCRDTCTNNGRVFDDGDTFTQPTNPCATCTCVSGEVHCTHKKCRTECTHPIGRGPCCPDCSACLFEGFKYNEGDVFFSRTDPCQQCSCSQGNVQCNVKRCPILDCDRPQSVRGKCCPECLQPHSSACTIGRREVEPGVQWTQYDQNENCQECECHEQGIVSCSNVTCSDDCEYPVPVVDKCCSACEDCFVNNQTFKNGKMFKPDLCRDCVCNHGNMRCISQECPPLSCPESRQIRTDGECCKQCVSCAVDDRFFGDGDKWTDPNDSCVECQCLNSVVTCAPVVCKHVCSNPVKFPGQCCPMCTGCIYNNKRYSIGDEFQPNPMNPCEVCECAAHAVTGAPALRCYRQQCPSLADCPRLCLQQPRAGTCCPTCTNRADCRYGLCTSAIAGRKITSSDDKCMHCTCTDDETWLCTREKCRTLDCPTNLQYTPQGGCCPVCDSCAIPDEDRTVASGTTWRVGICETCACELGAIACTVEQCQPLSCPAGMQPYKEDSQCCEKCANLNLPCRVEDKVFDPQQQWKVDQCTSCKCIAGKVKCITEKCRMMMCGEGESPVAIPGQCCPVCRQKPASCIAFGDPHYQTFDGRMLHFQGTCEYLLAADCVAGDFKIMVDNANNRPADIVQDVRGEVSWVNGITFLSPAGKIKVGEEVFFNGTKITKFPFFAAPHFQIEVSGQYVIVNTHLGVQIYWKSIQHHLEVTVPQIYQRRMCGLCGNYNSFPQDDLRMRNSQMTTSDATFGNDWKVTGPNIKACPDAVDISPCQSNTYAVRKVANDNCKVITSDIFAKCHPLVNPEMFFSACVYDACVCGEDNKLCICDALDAYSTQCKRAGVVVNWRSSDLCPKSCDGERGFIYNECASPCRRTCDNIEQNCYLPCVSGCQCPEGKVEYRGQCVNPDQCGSRPPQSIRLPPRGMSVPSGAQSQAVRQRLPPAQPHTLLRSAPREFERRLRPLQRPPGRPLRYRQGPGRLRPPYHRRNPQLFVPNLQPARRFHINN